MRIRHRTGAMTWDQLRKEARKIEGEVEALLVEYSKFNDQYSRSSLLSGGSGGGGDVDLEMGDQVYGTMALEIDQLLKRLSDVNADMSDIVSDLDTTSSAKLAPLLSHHRGKMHDFIQEFKKISNSIKATREHAELLHSVRRDITAYKDSPQESAAHRARRSLMASERTADIIVEQAQMSRENLANQRHTLKNTFAKMGVLGGLFTGIGSLMTNIQRKRTRDKVILALVISFCSALLFIYWLRDQGKV